MSSVLLASFPTAQINGRRGEIDFLKELQQGRLLKASWRVRECLMESGSAVLLQLLYAHRVILGPLAVCIASKEAVSE